MEDSETPIVKNEVEARGAVVGHNVRYVLLWGTLAAVAMMVILYFALQHSRPPV
ncbi:MAG: hypothetical protein NT113_14780 [Hyphomicrobiales bacterium]|nr:hypothetical protein [Hyphomicrobiales bacterium]